MALQMIYVNDAEPGACGDAGLVYNGSDTLTSSKLYSGTSIELSETLAVTGNTAVGGTLDVTGATSLSSLTATGDVVVYDLDVDTHINTTSIRALGDVIIEGICTHNGAVGLGGNQVLPGTHGAYVIPLTGLFTMLRTDETANIDASLANGQTGQLKIAILADYGNHDVVITPANFGNGTTLTLDAAKQYAVFLFDGFEWWALSHNGTIA